MSELGLYGKYEVLKDGKPVDGRVFVLRPDRDPAAMDALVAYANATSNKRLQSDIDDWLAELEWKLRDE